MDPIDRDYMIRTIIGEAADQPDVGQAAVASVILNRARKSGERPEAVVLAPHQFEPWDTRAAELRAISPKSPLYQKVGTIVDRVANGDIPDPTSGATHFLQKDIVLKRRGGTLPDWAQGPGMQIGAHTFYAPGNSGWTAARANPDIAQTLSDTGIVVPAAIKDFNDTTETLQQLGITLPNPLAPVQKTSVPSTAPAPGQRRIYSPEVQREAKDLGFSSAIVSGMPIVGPVENLARAAVRAGGYPVVGTGAPGATFGERFSKNVDNQLDAEKLYSEQHPVSSVVGNLLGGLAVTGPAAATRAGGLLLGTVGPNLASKLYTGAIGGAGIGAIDSLLRKESPVTGAEIGGAGGALGPILGTAARGTIGKSLETLRPPQGALGTLPNRQRSQILSALEGETPASIVAARTRMGPAGFFGDLNHGTTDLVGGLADLPGPSKGLVREAYRIRNEGQRQRIDDAITASLGPRINLANVTRAAKDDRKTAADPLYEAWRNVQVTPTPQLKKLTEQLEKEGMFKEANRLLAADGKKTYQKFFTPGSRNEWPTAEAWDYVKQAIDGKIRTAIREDSANDVRVWSNLKKRITNAIDNHPDDRVAGVWKAARDAWANPTAVMNARDLGRKLWSPKVRTDELGYVLTDFTPPERAAFREGARDELAQMMDRSARGDDNVRRMLESPMAQEKVFWISPNGRPNAQRLNRTVTSEEYLKDQNKNVTGGSPTVPKRERVEALKPGQLPEYNPNFTAPLTLIPPHIREGLRPSNVIEAWRGMNAARGNNALAQVLLTPEPQMDDLINSINRETNRRAARGPVLNRAGNAISTLITGPGTTTYRRQVQ